MVFVRCQYGVSMVIAWCNTQVNDLIRAAPRTTWSDGARPPPLHSSMLKGTKKGMPKRAGRLRYGAADMVKFAVASVDLFAHLVKPDDPVWVCWKAHVAYLKVSAPSYTNALHKFHVIDVTCTSQIMQRHAFTGATVEQLDKAIQHHQKLFLKACLPARPPAAFTALVSNFDCTLCRCLVTRPFTSPSITSRRIWQSTSCAMARLVATGASGAAVPICST